jgi:uncharacterized RDD family membrane protein YckC
MSYQPPQGGYGAPTQGYGAPPQGYGAPPPANYAGLGARLVAVILDSLIVSVGTIPGWIVFIIAAAGAAATADSRGHLSDNAGAAAGLGMFAGWALIFIGGAVVWFYDIYLLGRDGATLGKRWMKIRVQTRDGLPLGFGKAFLRELVKGVLGNLCFLLYLWPLWDAEKQGLHDKVLGTHVLAA